MEDVAPSAGGRTSGIGGGSTASQSVFDDAWILILGVLLETQINNLRFYSESLCDMTLYRFDFGVCFRDFGVGFEAPWLHFSSFRHLFLSVWVLSVVCSTSVWFHSRRGSRVWWGVVLT